MGTDERVFVGLGGNLGQTRAAIEQALDAIDALAGTHVLRRSPLYRSAPVDASGPDYLNAVAEVSTVLEPHVLLAALQTLEQQAGRQRPHRNAPRTLDLDLLLYGTRVVATPALTLPHPRLHQRAFVLRPLADLAPGLELPGLGDLGPWLRACADQRCERLDPAVEASAAAPGTGRGLAGPDR